MESKNKVGGEVRKEDLVAIQASHTSKLFFFHGSCGNSYCTAYQCLRKIKNFDKREKSHPALKKVSLPFLYLPIIVFSHSVTCQERQSHCKQQVPKYFTKE